MASVSSSTDAFERMKRDLDRIGSSATETSIKKDLKRFVDGLSPEEALRFVDMVNNWLDDDELTPEEEEDIRISKEEFARGEFVTMEEIERELGL